MRVFDPNQLEGRKRSEWNLVFDQLLNVDRDPPFVPVGHVLIQNREWDDNDDLIVVRILRSLVGQRLSVLEGPLVGFESGDVYHD